MKLISMTDFVLQNTSQKFENFTNENLLIKIRRYAQFLKQEPNQKMFIGKEKIFEGFHVGSFISLLGEEVREIYCEVNFYKLIIFSKRGNEDTRCHFNTIDDLVKYNLKLTESALKQIGL